MGLLAAVENIFPPIPADVLVAFGGFLAARGGQSPWPAFLCVWIGNVLGALAMYALGRRFGAAWITRRFRLEKGTHGEARVVAWYQKYGTPALFMTRFVPGLRAVLPPIAGGLRIPMPGVALSIAGASGLWYGLITWLAFSTGANWGALSAAVSRLGLGMAVGAVALLGMVGFFAWHRHQRKAG